MNRSKISDKMIKYLEDRVNCENIIKFVTNNADDTPVEDYNTIDRIVVDKVPVAFKIVSYSEQIENEQTKTKAWIKNMFKIFDFITESNYTGFEYFPYLYGVLTCHDETNKISTVYIFYEHFDGNLVKLFDTIEHPSDWYDIVFQMVMINYYINVLHNYSYNSSPKNHLYKKMHKPIYKDYEVDNFKFRISHKYLIVIWDIESMEPVSNEVDATGSNISSILKYLNDPENHLKIPASNRILKLLNDVKNNPENSISILNTYYNIE